MHSFVIHLILRKMSCPRREPPRADKDALIITQTAVGFKFFLFQRPRSCIFSPRPTYNGRMPLKQEVTHHGSGSGRLDLRRAKLRAEQPLIRGCCRCVPTDAHGGFSGCAPLRSRSPMPRRHGALARACGGNSAFLLNIAMYFCLLKH